VVQESIPHDAVSGEAPRKCGASSLLTRIEGGVMVLPLAIAGTGLGIIGLIVLILLVILVLRVL
jgi:hypothetical protein